jgi:lysophospholipase L1-like esterase
VLTLALKLALSPLLIGQAVQVRRRAPVLPEAAGERRGLAPPRPGEHGSIAPGATQPLRLLIVGDSSAAGVGVATQDQALAGPLARALATTLARPVVWQLVARSGVTTRGALGLLREQAPAGVGPADLAVAVLGVNDVVDQVPVRRAIAQRAELADWLTRHAGVRHTVFAPLPPMHRFPLLPQPLRWVLGREALHHDRALARWAAGRRDCSHLAIDYALGPEAMADDGFHPGEPVYRACAEALARHIALHIPDPTTEETTP